MTANPALGAVLFDLDGVIVSTDEYHYRAWKRMADAEGVYFDRKINERLRGVSRMASLEIVLEKASRPYTSEEKQAMAEKKNLWYQQLIGQLTPAALLPGALEFLKAVRAEGLKTAVASSSKNAGRILERVGLADSFDAVVTGADIRHSKPDPEVFLLAAGRVGVEPIRCLVVEDSYAGIDAASAGGMRSLGVGYAAGYGGADFHAANLAAADIGTILCACAAAK